MIFRPIVVCLALLPLCLTSATSMDDPPPSPQKILEKAFEAAGGKANLQKYKAATLTGKGIIFNLGEGDLPLTMELNYSGPSMFRSAVFTKVMDQSLKIITVVNGEKGWAKENEGEAKLLGKEELESEKSDFHAYWLTRLTPLIGNHDYKISPLGEKKIKNKSTLGVQISKAGFRDAKLFFDKNTWLLVQMETKGKDSPPSKKEVTRTIYFSNYQRTRGIQIPMREEMAQDGKTLLEVTYTGVQLVEKLDVGLFSQP